MFTITALLFGLIIGSFLTACVYRIPFGREKGPPTLEELSDDYTGAGEPEQTSVSEAEEGMSLLEPRRSICPQCKKQLLWWHNIPLVSYLLLRGKCGFCGARISFRYPLIEGLSASFAVLSLYAYGLTPTALVVFAFCAALIAISFIDIEYYIIPDVISYPGITVGIILGAINHFYHIFDLPVVPDIWSSLIGFVLGGGVLLFISEVYFRLRNRVGLGMGDVKLLAMTGACFGVEGALFSMFVGSLVGSVIGVLLMIFRGKNMSYQLPFGPYLALGTILYLFSGDLIAGLLGVAFIIQ